MSQGQPAMPIAEAGAIALIACVALLLVKVVLQSPLEPVSQGFLAAPLLLASIRCGFLLSYRSG